MGPSFWEKSSDGLGLEGLKSRKVRFLGFWQKFDPFGRTFLLQYKIANAFFWPFPKTKFLQKFWFLSYGSKNSKQMRIEES